MKLVDIMPIEKWIAIENEIQSRSGLNAAVYDVNGLRITDFIKWANRLCPSLRATEKGQELSVLWLIKISPPGLRKPARQS